jgi:hypothetical protein
MSPAERQQRLEKLGVRVVRIHGSLRVTPAMAAGVTDRAGDLDELSGVPLIGRFSTKHP